MEQQPAPSTRRRAAAVFALSAALFALSAGAARLASPPLSSESSLMSRITGFIVGGHIPSMDDDLTTTGSSSTDDHIGDDDASAAGRDFRNSESTLSGEDSDDSTDAARRLRRV